MQEKILRKYIESTQLIRATTFNFFSLIKYGIFIWLGFVAYILIQYICGSYLGINWATLISPMLISLCIVPFIDKGKTDNLTKLPLYSTLIAVPVILISVHYSSTITDVNMEQYVEALSQLRPSVLIMSTIILAPISEELFFRGFLYTQLKRMNLPKEVAVLLSTFVFVIAHGTETHIIPAFIMGIIFCIVYEVTNNILYNIICHSLYNMMIFILGSIITQVNIVTMGVSTVLLFIMIYLFCDHVRKEKKGI